MLVEAAEVGALMQDLQESPKALVYPMVLQ
jgi:hypothetical protein